jgi:pSer/pThr/pTyr-binding forkhead associated (FHA) protein
MEPATLRGIQLELRAPGQPARQLSFTQDVVLIGRDPKNDVAFEDRNASRHHARLVRVGGAFELEDLGSLNGTRVNERPAVRVRLEAGDQIRVGAHSIVVLALRPESEAEAASPESGPLDCTRVAAYPEPPRASTPDACVLLVERDGQVVTSQALHADITTLGRDPACGVVLPDDDVSRHHARILRKHGRYYLEDLDSLNGTFVDGEPVYSFKLAADPPVQIGPYLLRLRSALPAEPDGGGAAACHCLSCHRPASRSWPACPFCASAQAAAQLDVVLEPLRAPDPRVARLDPATPLELTEERLAAGRQFWISFLEPDGMRHPVGQVPETVHACPRCLFVAEKDSALHLCPACSAAWLGPVQLGETLRDWTRRAPVRVGLRMVEPSAGGAARVHVTLRPARQRGEP